MKKYLLLPLLLASCAGEGDSYEDNRVFNCSASLTTEAISLDDFDQRVSEGENLVATSSFEANGEQFVVVNVCSEVSDDEQNTTVTTTSNFDL